MLLVVVPDVPHLQRSWHGANGLGRLAQVPQTTLNGYLQFCTPRAHCEIRIMFTHTVAATDRALSDAWLLAAKKKAFEELEAEEPDDDGMALTGATDWDVHVGDAAKAFLHQQGKRCSSAAARNVTKLPVIPKRRTQCKKEKK